VDARPSGRSTERPPAAARCDPCRAPARVVLRAGAGVPCEEVGQRIPPTGSASGCAAARRAAGTPARPARGVCSARCSAATPCVADRCLLWLRASTCLPPGPPLLEVVVPAGPGPAEADPRPRPEHRPAGARLGPSSDGRLRCLRRCGPRRPPAPPAAAAGRRRVGRGAARRALRPGAARQAELAASAAGLGASVQARRRWSLSDARAESLPESLLRLPSSSRSAAGTAVRGAGTKHGPLRGLASTSPCRPAPRPRV
jgi:hypothetical protein